MRSRSRRRDRFWWTKQKSAIWVDRCEGETNAGSEIEGSWQYSTDSSFSMVMKEFVSKTTVYTTPRKIHRKNSQGEKTIAIILKRRFGLCAFK